MDKETNAVATTALEAASALAERLSAVESATDSIGRQLAETAHAREHATLRHVRETTRRDI